MDRPIRILIVDDHPLMREGLRRVFEISSGLEVVGDAGNGEDGLKACRELRPDVLVLDLNMPGMGGVEVTRALHAEFPDLPIVILTVHDDTLHLDEALQAGATSYCLKDVDPDILVQTVRRAVHGESYIDPELQRRSASMAQLTRREMEVLRMVAEGLSNREIGERLHISEKTARNHISNIFLKINVQDRTQAALYAVQQGWVPGLPG